MTIVLVRHGETAGNASRIVQVADTPLNETGLQQAEQLAGRLAQLAPTHLMSSDHPRAMMTAEPVARATGLTIERCSLLRERNFGDLRGTPWSAFPEGHPYSPDLEPPNGESWAVFHARVDRAFALVTARRAEVGGTLIVITHGLVLRSIASRLLPPGLPPPAAFANTGVTILDGRPPYAAQVMNSTSHLRDAAQVAGAS